MLEGNQPFYKSEGRATSLHPWSQGRCSAPWQMKRVEMIENPAQILHLMESMSQNDRRHHYMGFLHNRLKMQRQHSYLIWSWGCLEHQPSEESWKERAKHQAWSGGKESYLWKIWCLGAKNICYQFSYNKCSSVFSQQVLISFLTAPWSSADRVMPSINSHQMVLESVNFVQKDRVQSEVVTRALQKAKVKTWKGTEDLKTSRCTYWRGGLLESKQPQTIWMMLVTSGVQWRKTQQKHTEAMNILKQVLQLTSHMICVLGSFHLIPFARQVVYLLS